MVSCFLVCVFLLFVRGLRCFFVACYYHYYIYPFVSGYYGVVCGCSLFCSFVFVVRVLFLLFVFEFIYLVARGSFVHSGGDNTTHQNQFLHSCRR